MKSVSIYSGRGTGLGSLISCRFGESCRIGSGDFVDELESPTDNVSSFLVDLLCEAFRLVEASAMRDLDRRECLIGVSTGVDKERAAGSRFVRL